MAVEHQEPVYRQIRNLLLVLTLGIASAGTFAGILLYYYSPSGIYKLGNVMVSPEVINGLSYADQDSATGQVSRFAFDKMEFSYWNVETRQWRRVPVGLPSYTQFYDKFSGETSVGDVAEATINQFHVAPPAKLALTVRTEGEESKSTTRVFQEVHFSNEGDFYRVELHEQSSDNNWAYFYYPNMYREALSIFSGADQ